MKKLVLICLGVMLLSSVALADDVFPPNWRNQSGWSQSQWDNWGGFPETILPDSMAGNPHIPTGPTFATALAGSNLRASEFNRSNVLYLNQQDGLVFHLDNFDTTNPTKLVRIQITYNITDLAAGIPNGFDVWANGQPDMFVPAVPVQSTGPDANGWITAAYDFLIQPNPFDESIGLKFVSQLGPQAPFNAFIDQIVIDTICIPEPATVGLLILGLGLLRRKR